MRSVTRITIRPVGAGLFDDWQGALDEIDIDASLVNYNALLVHGLLAAYPDADIELSRQAAGDITAVVDDGEWDEAAELEVKDMLAITAQRLTDRPNEWIVEA